MEDVFYLTTIRQELERRIQSNSAYSLRAYSRSIQLDPAYVSRVLSAKVLPSAQATRKFLGSLRLDPNEVQLFLTSIVEARAKRSLNRIQNAATPGENLWDKVPTDWKPNLNSPRGPLQVVESVVIHGTSSEAREKLMRFAEELGKNPEQKFGPDSEHSEERKVLEIRISLVSPSLRSKISKTS